ncbi:hypothetical protein GGX14DRAFT_502746 [Mycena pura]|uniref:Zn(2)-C6 fungal-type domain-containing protein n=1 Tax=Mycena pura TaxID=153505 RepID=A0AAD6V2X6_9AGAR|nr:hypothetical protein GGX14DRAFT_502746 [Mycena pura]
MSVDDKRDSAKSRAQPLRRGRACLVCRKCDGKSPMCGPCKRAPKEEPCEFTEIFSRTDLLENTVFRLRSRITELERGSPKSIDHSHLQCWPPPELSRSDSPFGGSSAGSPSSPHSASSSQSPFFGAQEPPTAMIQMLLDYFLPHGVQFGFFLRLDHFKESALLRFGDALRPSPALLSVVYLWGIHLSQSEPLLSSEPVFLKRAQQQLSIEISESRHPTHLLHTVQAQVLLSTYMFRNRRCLEAEFHANSAATLVLGYRLHQILSARPPARSPSFTATEPTVFLAPPQSAVEEGERIRAFWAVACLQSSLHMALRSASTSLSILECASKDIDTPWPLEIADYEAELFPTAYHGQETITAFLTDDPPLASAPSTLHAKAAVLLHRASRLGSKWSPSACFASPSAILTFPRQIYSPKHSRHIPHPAPGSIAASASSGTPSRRYTPSTRTPRPRAPSCSCTR